MRTAADSADRTAQPNPTSLPILLPPLPRSIPPLSSVPGYDKVASLLGGSKGGYAAKGGFASVGAATPISAGAYGSA